MFLNKDIHIKSIRNGYHLGVTPSGLPYAHPNRCSWERFRIIGSSNSDVMVKSHNGYFLSSNGSSVFASKDTAHARWVLVKVKGGYKLRRGDRYLKVHNTAPYACFYQHCDYSNTGWQKCLGPGDYDWVVAAGIPNDDMSSAKVGFGLQVTLYEHHKFQGRSWTLPHGQAIPCFVPNGWNDNVSSLRIRDTLGARDLKAERDGTVFDLSEPGQLSMFTSKRKRDYCGMYRYPMGPHWMYASQKLNIKWLESVAKAEEHGKHGKILRHIDGKGAYGALWMSKGQTRELELKITDQLGGALAEMPDGTYMDFTNGAKWVVVSRPATSAKADKVVGEWKGGVPVTITKIMSGKYVVNKTVPGAWRNADVTYNASSNNYSFVFNYPGGKKDRLTATITEASPAWISYNQLPPKNTRVDLGYNLKAWSGGWRDGHCPPGDRYMFFGVAVNGKMLVGQPVAANKVKNPLGRGKSGTPESRCHRGLNTVVLSPEGALIEHKSFDTHGDSYAADKFADHLRSVTAKRDDDRLIVIGTYDEGQGKLNENAMRAIGGIGGRRIGHLGFRGSYLVVYHPRSDNTLYENINNCGDVEYEQKCGIRCRPLYDPDYYKGKYADIRDKSADELAGHWESVGLKEGRRASQEFDAVTYGSMYDDLRGMRGNNVGLANHYMNVGIGQGRQGAFDMDTKFDGLIVNGLQCYLDARSRKSLVNGAKQWRDLSGKGHHFTFSSPVVTDGLRADMASCGQGKGPAASSFGIGKGKNGGGYTVTAVVRCKMLTAETIRNNKGGSFMFPGKGVDRGISGHICWTDGKVYFDNMGCCTTDTQRQSHQMGNACYHDVMYTFVRTSTGGLDVYVNGERKVKGQRGKAIMPALTGAQVLLGNDANWHADMQLFIVHNTGLPKHAIASIYQWYVKTSKTYRSALLDTAEGKAKAVFGDQIPIRGLTFALDAGDGRCYKPGTATLKDISGNNRPVTFLNGKSPKFADHSWVFDGDRSVGIVGPPSTSLGITGSEGYTVAVRTKLQRLTDSLLFEQSGYRIVDQRGRISRNRTGKRALAFVTAHLDGHLYWDQDGYLNRMSINAKHLNDKMVVIVMVRNNTGRSLYVNGERVHHVRGAGSDLTPSSGPLSIINTPGYPEPYVGHLSHLFMYRTALTESEVQKLTAYIDNPYKIRDSTWAAAQQVCSQDGSVMCDADMLCYGGKPINRGKVTNAMSPISSGVNTWINLDTCKTQTFPEGHVQKNAHIRCCPVERNNNYFTAACNYKRIVYFFRKDAVLRYSINGAVHNTLSIKKISNQFPGIPESFNADIDAAGITHDGKLYLFKNNLGMIYDLNGNKVDTPPKLITGLLGPEQVVTKLPPDFRGYYDTVLTIGRRLVLFKGPNVFRYGKKYKLANLIPGNIMDSGVDAWMRLEDGNTIAAREGYLYHFNAKKMMPLLDYFYDLKPPFVTAEERCRALQNMQRELTRARDAARGTNPGLYAQYGKRLEAVNKEHGNQCNHRTMHDFKSAVAPREAKLKDTRDKIQQFQKKQNQSLAITKTKSAELRKTKRTVAELQREIDAERAKGCPTRASCAKRAVKYKGDNKRKTCSAAMIKHVLKRHGYNPQQIAQLSTVLDKEPSIDDHDIRTHGDFHKYTGKHSVRDCKDDMNLPEHLQKLIDVGDTDYNSLMNTLRNDPKARKAQCSIRALERDTLSGIGNEMEKRAFKILKESLLKYHLKYVHDNIPEGTEGKQESEEATTMKEMSSATKKLVCNLQVDENVAKHLQLLKDIQAILSKTHNHPNYKKIAGDIKKLQKKVKKLKAGKAQGTIPAEIQEMERQITVTEQRLAARVGQLKTLHKA